MGAEPLKVVFRSTLANGDIAEYAFDADHHALILLNGKPITTESDPLSEYQRLLQDSKPPPPPQPKPLPS